VTDAELRALAQVALRSPRTPVDRLSRRLGDLAEGPATGFFHALDRLWRDGLVACDDGWHVTEAGWRAIDATGDGETS